MALIEQGKVDDLPVIGHGVTRVGLAAWQLAAGQLMVAHAEEYLYTVFFKGGSDPGDRAPPLSEIKGAIQLTKRAHAFVTVDLNTYATIAKQWGKPEVADTFLRMPEIRYLDPDDRILWKSSSYVNRRGDLSARLAFLKGFLQSAGRRWRSASYRHRHSFYSWPRARLFFASGLARPRRGGPEPLPSPLRGNAFTRPANCPCKEKCARLRHRDSRRARRLNPFRCQSVG